MEALIKQLKDLIESKDKRIVELEGIVANDGRVIHNHYHYDQPCTRQHYPTSYWQSHPYWTTGSINCGATNNAIGGSLSVGGPVNSTASTA